MSGAAVQRPATTRLEYDYGTGERVQTAAIFCPVDGGSTAVRACIHQDRPLLVLCCTTCAWEGYVSDGKRNA